LQGKYPLRTGLLSHSNLSHSNRHTH